MSDTETIPIEVAQDRSEERAAAHQGVIRGLSVDGIGKRYDKRVVLRDVSLSVRRGEVVGLLGPNGAGKTTCFYSIMGLAMPDSGRILLDGHDITGLPMYRRAALGLGYLPQETSRHDRRTEYPRRPRSRRTRQGDASSAA
jgi:lipopolysaccharide export system ATP-binding protein